MTHPGHLSGQDFPSCLPLGQIGLTKVHNVFWSYPVAYLQCTSVVYIQFIMGANSVGFHLIHAGSNIQVQEEPGTHKGWPGPWTGNCPQWSTFHITVDQAGPNQDRSLGSKLTFKLNWSFQLFLAQMSSGKKENVLWSNETREMLGRPHVRPLYLHYGSTTILLHCITWMESKFFNFTSTATQWHLDKVGCSNRTAIPNKHQN